MNYALILFGGVGSRFGENYPKQFFVFNEKPLLFYSIKSMSKSKNIDKIYIVSDSKHIDLMEQQIIKFKFDKVVKIVPGGETRQESVLKGLESLKIDKIKDDDIVFIHDGDRLLVDERIICDALDALQNNDGVIPTLKEENSVIIDGKYVNRDKVNIIQTPQVFRFGKIFDAHTKLKDKLFTDDGSIFLANGNKLNVIDGDKKLLKITSKEDIVSVANNLKNF